MARRRSYGYDYGWGGYEPSEPIRVEGGIKAKSQWGRFVQHWWGDRWIQALTGLMDTGRLSRGRSYARQGQVLEIDIGAGHIKARVQGSRRTPYKVDIRLRPLSDAQWSKVFDALADQAIFAAQLLNGEMPQEIEKVFETAQVPLFPASRGDLDTDCSCPDPANPCKHIAAVYYLLGEQFDGDPFLLLELRGRTKEEIASALRERRAGASDAVGEAPISYWTDTVEATGAAPLEDCLDTYWSLDAQAEDLAIQIASPKVSMALLKRLGRPDFVNESTFRAQMERVYEGITAQALRLAFADTGPTQEEQLAVLAMLRENKITVDEAELLLKALRG